MTVTVNCRAPRARRCLIRGRECLQQGACSAQLQCKRASACQGTHRHLCPLWPPRSHTLAQHILLPRTPLVEGTTGSERRADWRSSAALLRTPEAYSWWLPGLALHVIFGSHAVDRVFRFRFMTHSPNNNNERSQQHAHRSTMPERVVPEGAHRQSAVENRETTEHSGSGMVACTDFSGVRVGSLLQCT
jgi:hypothetical protein